MALSNKERQEALRKRRAALGQKGRLVYLTNDEFKKIKEFLEKLRAETNNYM